MYRYCAGVVALGRPDLRLSRVFAVLFNAPQAPQPPPHCQETPPWISPACRRPTVLCHCSFVSFGIGIIDMMAFADAVFYAPM